MTKAETTSAVAASLDDERDMEEYGQTADAAISAYYVMEAGDDSESSTTIDASGVMTAKAGDSVTKIDLGASGVVKPALPPIGAPVRIGAGEIRPIFRKGDVKIDPKNPLAGLPPEFQERLQKAIKAQVKIEVAKALKERETKEREKAKERLKVRKDEHNAIAGAAKGVKWVVDATTGTESRSFESDVTKTVNGQTLKRHVSISRTRKSDTKVLVAAHDEFTETLPSGLSRSSVRDKAVQADGSYNVTFHSEITFKDGTVRTADWAKTIAADGKVTGTGTITWTAKDGKVLKTVNVTLNGTEDNQTAAAGDVAVKLPADGEAQTNDGKAVDTTEATTTTDATAGATGDASADASVTATAGDSTVKAGTDGATASSGGDSVTVSTSGVSVSSDK
jgi:hypothetical protein